MIIDIYPPVARPTARPVSFVWPGAGSLVLILLVILGAVAINAVGATVAYYSDTETSRGNFFSAGSLDFTVEAKKPDNEDEGLSPGGSIVQLATVLNRGSLDFQYTVEVEKTGGDDNFCRTLDIEAGLEGATAYTGKLMDFVSLPVLYSTSTDDWKFVISLPSDVTAEGSCSFDFVFSGWQTNSSEFSGFSDIEKNVVSVTVESENDNESEVVAEITLAPISIEGATSTEATPTSIIPVVIEEATTTPFEIEEATSTEAVSALSAIEKPISTTTPPIIEELPSPIPVSEPEPAPVEEQEPVAVSETTPEPATPEPNPPPPTD